MFSIGWGELLIVLGVALFFIGPKQLPGLARHLARIIRDLTKARDEWLDIFRKDESLKDIRNSIDEVKSSASKPVQDFKQAFNRRLQELDEDSKTEKFAKPDQTQPMAKPSPLEQTHVMPKETDDVLDESTELYHDGESPSPNDQTDKIERPNFDSKPKDPKS